MATQQRATYGPTSYESIEGGLPGQYPRTMGPNAMRYLQEVVGSGLSRSCDMVGRFERAFARELGVKHCIGTPGCTPALACLAVAFDFEPGDEIIVSPITDYGTIQGLIKENYIPVFPDTKPAAVYRSGRQRRATHCSGLSRGEPGFHQRGLPRSIAAQQPARQREDNAIGRHDLRKHNQ